MSIELKVKGLEDLIKTFGEKTPTVKVGILGDKNSRSDKANGNAEIGARHEFGEGDLPVRSFLRMPIAEKIQKYLEDAGALDADTVKSIVDQKSLSDFVKKIGLVAEAIIQDAFNTGGFGHWRPSDMKRKKNHQTLVETQQLRNSITSEVDE